MNRRLLLGLSSPIFLFFFGCAEFPERTRAAIPFEQPDNWYEETLETVLISDQWWREFDCPELDDMVQEALRNNPTINEAAFRIESAWAFARIVGADQLPQANVDGSVARQRIQIANNPFRITNHQVALNLSWELDLWGRIRSGREAAFADVQASEAAYEGVRLALIAEIARTYLDLTVEQKLVDIAREDFESIRSLTARIEDRYRTGLRTAFDLRVSRGSREQARARLIQTEQNLELLRKELEVLLGRYPTGEVAGSTELPAMPPTPGGVPSTLLERRPDLAESERRLAAALKRLGEAHMAKLPRISLTASGGSGAAEFEDLFNSGFGIWSLAGNLAAPIFQGGRLSGEVDRTAAEAGILLQQYYDLILNAFTEVESTLANEEFLELREEALRDAADESRASLEISESRYFRGLLPIIDLLQVRTQFYADQTALLRIQTDRLINRVNLIVSLGGGFSVDQLTATERRSP